MPRRGLRDLGGHPPPRNFQPHQPLNHCPHLQPPHQSQLEPSREPRRGPRDDFSVLGWVLCGHRFAVSRARFALGVKRVRIRGAASVRGFLQLVPLVYRTETHVYRCTRVTRVQQDGHHPRGKCVSYSPTSSCASPLCTPNVVLLLLSPRRKLRVVQRPSAWLARLRRSQSSPWRQQLSHFYVYIRRCATALLASHGYFAYGAHVIRERKREREKETEREKKRDVRRNCTWVFQDDRDES